MNRRIAELTAQLKQNSSSSSKPPSSDPPQARMKRRPKSSGRKRGGQPGHDKHERALVPPEKVTATEVVKPEYCRACSHPLFGDDPNPFRHQVIGMRSANRVVT